MSGWGDYGFNDSYGIGLRPYLVPANGLRAAAVDHDRFDGSSELGGYAFGQRFPLTVDAQPEHWSFAGLDWMQCWQLAFDYALYLGLGTSHQGCNGFVDAATYTGNPAQWEVFTWDSILGKLTSDNLSAWVPSHCFAVQSAGGTTSVAYDHGANGNLHVLIPSATTYNAWSVPYTSGWAGERRRLLDQLYLLGKEWDSVNGDYDGNGSVTVEAAAESWAGTPTPPVDMRTQGITPLAAWSCALDSATAHISGGCYRIHYTRRWSGSEVRAALYLDAMPSPYITGFGNPFFVQGWNVKSVGNDGLILDESMADACGLAEGLGSVATKLIVVENIFNLLAFSSAT